MTEMKVGRLELTRFTFRNQMEEHGAAILSPLQVRHIENVLVEVCEQKIGQEIDSKDIAAGALQSAYLKGQIDILRYLLELSATMTPAGQTSEGAYKTHFSGAEDGGI